MQKAATPSVSFMVAYEIIFVKSKIAFGVKVPILLLAPYVPFEFFTGIYILIKYRKKITHIFFAAMKYSGEL